MKPSKEDIKMLRKESKKSIIHLLGNFGSKDLIDIKKEIDKKLNKK